MAMSCTVCGTWYPTDARDTLGICTPCLDLNFSGTQPPRDPPLLDVSAREALEAFVDNAHQLTPRQVEAMRRMAERWQEDEHD